MSVFFADIPKYTKKLHLSTIVPQFLLAEIIFIAIQFRQPIFFPFLRTDMLFAFFAFVIGSVFFVKFEFHGIAFFIITPKPDKIL